MSEPRCNRCGAKLAEFVEGRVVITCRKCRNVVLLTGKPEVDAATLRKAVLD